jgi:ketosteroid isomerase-like protein
MNIRQRLVELCDAFNAHDLDKIMSMFADDCVLETPRGVEPCGTRRVGRAAVREGLAARFVGLPDVQYNDGEHFADEAANAGMSRWRLTGTQPDGKRLEVFGCDFFTFRDGLVTRKDSYWKIVD